MDLKVLSISKNVYMVSTTAIRASISDDWSSTGFMEAAEELESTSGVNRDKLREKRDKERQKERAKVEKEKENEEETVKVYDGYSSLRKRLFRTVTVNKTCSKEELLMTAMRAFVVSQDSRNFYLLDVYANTEQPCTADGCGGADRDEEIQVGKQPFNSGFIFVQHLCGFLAGVAI